MMLVRVEVTALQCMASGTEACRLGLGEGLQVWRPVGMCRPGACGGRLAGVHLRSGGGGQGHVEEESAAPS